MEFVLVIKRYDLFDLSFPHGFVAAADDDRVERWSKRIREKSFFVERRWAEQDSTLKQVIPYVVMAHGDEVFLLKRLDTGGEARLHGKLSIGVGGHINPVDEAGSDAGSGSGGDPDDVLDAGCRRELEEELAIDTTIELTPRGVINDESGDVGSVHFGLVQVARCASTAVAIRETDQLEGSWIGRDALAELADKQGDRFETWSKMIIDRLPALLDG